MAYFSTKHALLAAAALILCLGLVAAPNSAAEQAQPEQTAAAKAPADVSVDVAGVTVFVDPETGRLRQPTAEQARDLAEALRRHFGGMDKAITAPKSERRADGTLVYRSAPEFMNYTIGLAAPGGETATTCAPSLEQAISVLENPQSTLEALRASRADANDDAAAPEDM